MAATNVSVAFLGSYRPSPIAAGAIQLYENHTVNSITESREGHETVV